MGNKRKKDIRCKVRIEFFANNVSGVTGSSQLISFYDKDLDKEVNILLELGSYQEGSVLDNYNNNYRLLNKLDVKNIDFVIMLHNHADHSLLIPHLATREFDGQIITTKENKSILPIMWSDACYINTQEIEWLKRYKKAKDRNYQPYYKTQHIEAIQEYIKDIQVDTIINLTPNIQIKLLPNRHILGSVSCELFFKDLNSRVHKLFYSSDLGNVIGDDNYFTYETQKPPKNSSISIYESTYGKFDRDFIGKKLRKKELILLENTIRETIKRGGNCLIPCFSLNRTPVMALRVKKILDNNDDLKHTPIVIDGKLTNELLDVYERVCEGNNKEYIDELLSWDNLIRVRAYKETCKITDDKKPKIVLSSSGFLNAGHVLEYCKQYLPSKKNTIIFCGYSPEGSIASKIKQKDETHQKTVKIDKSTVLMNAEVAVLESFSSHIMRQDLIKYVLQTNTSDYICFIHGSADAKADISSDITKRLEDECLSTKVIIPKKNQVIYF